MNKVDELLQKDEYTKKELQEAIEQTVKEVQSIKELNDFLHRLHPADAYKAIRDIVQPKSNRMLRDAKDNDIEQYQIFQDIQQEAKQMWNFMHKTATIEDVQELIAENINRYYNILVRMISKVDDELGLVEQAVNTIEERLEIPKTDFNVLKEEITDDATGNDEQGEQESTTGVGEVSN